MIELDGNWIELTGKRERIKKWEVWFQTPGGLFVESNEALEWCRKNDLTILLVTPVCVAVSESLYEIFIR